MDLRGILAEDKQVEGDEDFRGRKRKGECRRVRAVATVIFCFRFLKRICSKQPGTTRGNSH